MEIKGYGRRAAGCVCLSASLVLTAVAAFAAQYQVAQYYWSPDEDVEWAGGSENDGTLQPEGWVSVTNGAAIDFTVDWSGSGKSGWAVDHWRYTQFSGGFPNDPDCGAVVEDSAGQTNLLWQCEDSNEFHLAVKFRFLTYDLAYDGNGGGKTEGISDCGYTNAVTLAASPTSPTGHSFVAWQEADGGVRFSAGQTVTGADFAGLDDAHTDGTVVKLVAQWSSNVHNLDCQLNGGVWTNGFVAPASVPYDTVFALPPPTRTGYDFLGWKVTENLDGDTARWGTGKDPSLTLTADTLCVNGANPVYFKNLNPTGGVEVRLTALWSPSTIRVSFNNMGATSGKECVDVTYDAAYGSVNAPMKAGSTFLGYAIAGETYWNADGQPAKAVWGIPTNCTAIAQWDRISCTLIYDENRTDGKSSMTEVLGFQYGESVTLSDGTFDGGETRFENFGCTLLGWSISKQASTPEYGLGEVKAFTESKTLYAIWEKNFFISYDGNGATEGEMAVQKLVLEKSGQTLSANAFTKTGYGFLGWATNRSVAASGDWQYADHAVLPSGSAVVLGQTNVLFATWKANGYFVDFDANVKEGVDPGPAMAVLPCTYDQPVTLPKCTYVNGAYDFIGWSNTLAQVVYTNLDETVLNLCERANGTNTLVAIWRLSALSAAMHCDNLRWESYAYENPLSTNAWTIVTGEGVGKGSDSCVRQMPYADRSVEQQWLTAKVTADGSVSFHWKPSKGIESLYVWWTVDIKDSFKEETGVQLAGVAGEWNECRLSGIPKDYYLKLCWVSQIGHVDIDQMVWKPDSPLTNAVPVAIAGLVYDGAAQTGVVDGVGYSLAGNVATNAGEYVATATLEEGYVWAGGATGPTNIAWSIAKAVYDMDGVVFTNETYVADGRPHSIVVSGAVPEGVSVGYANNVRTEPGAQVATASFAGDAANYEPIADRTATLTIEEPPVPQDPTVAYVGFWFNSPLSDLGVPVTTTATKLTIKAEGFPAGLKLQTQTLRDGQKKIVGYDYAVAGVPTEELDGTNRVAFVRITENGKPTLWALDLHVLSASAKEQKTLPDGTNRLVYANFSLTSLWPALATNSSRWAVSGLPTGLKYATKTVTTKVRVSGKYVLVTNALACEVYGTPTKAGRFTLKAVETLADKTSRNTHVAGCTIWPDNPEFDEAWTTRAYEAVNRAASDDVASASGLPTGVKFSSKTHLFSGKPTKVGTFAVTLTHADKGKSQFLWTIEPAAPPAFEIDLAEAPADPATLKRELRQGVAYAWPIAVDVGAKVTASGLPTGLKLVSSAIKEGRTTVGYRYAVSGVPTAVGEFYALFKTAMNGQTKTVSAAFVVVALPDWAQGTFDGGADETVADVGGGQVTLAVSKAGKISGKWLGCGTNWTLNAAAYARYEREGGRYLADLVFKTGTGKSLRTQTNELAVAADDVCGGIATNLFFVSYLNRWKQKPWKTIGKSFGRAPACVYVPEGFGTNDTVTLKVAASGKVTVTGRFQKSVDVRGRVTWYTASGSAVLCPQTEPADDGSFDGAVFVYLPPKSKTPLASGYFACIRLRWTGTRFERACD